MCRQLELKDRGERGALVSTGQFSTERSRAQKGTQIHTWIFLLVFEEHLIAKISSAKNWKKKLEDRMWNMLECFEQMRAKLSGTEEALWKVCRWRRGRFHPGNWQGACLLLCDHIFSIGQFATCHCLGWEYITCPKSKMVKYADDFLCFPHKGLCNPNCF